MFKKKELKAGTFPMLSQNFRVAEQFGNPLYHWDNLVPADKCIQAGAEVGLGRQATRDAQ